MKELKVATFNCEWMLSMFGAPRDSDWLADPRIPETFPGAARGSIRLERIEDVHDLCRRVARVIRTVDPDVLFIQEGPPLVEQMQLFVERFLDDDYAAYRSNRDNQAVFGFVRRTLADKIRPWTPGSATANELWARIPYYPWGRVGSDSRKLHAFARQPLFLKGELNTEQHLVLCGVHTKSKFSLLKTRKQWDDRRDEPRDSSRNPVLNALDSRAKLSAEVRRLRAVLDQILATGPQLANVAVLGDFNDGPFFDLMESEFLIHNILDELVGSLLRPNHYFKHAMEPDRLATAATTRFRDPLQEGRPVEELIDHIVVSAGIWSEAGAYRVRPGSCVVEHAAWQAGVVGSSEARRENRPSDHMPVSVVIEYA